MENYNKVYRKGVFIVVYRTDKKTGNREYLLLKRWKHWRGWEFPKGGVDKKEKEAKAVKREILEETGLKPLEIKAFNFRGKYKYKDNLKDRPGFVGQTYLLFSAKVGPGKVIIDEKEHSSYGWFDFDRALKKIKYNDQKKCLKIVEISNRKK